MKTIEQEIHTISPENLPPRWALATIAEMIGAEGVFSDGDWVVSKDQDPHGDVRLVQLADIGDGVWLDKSSKYLSHDKAIELRCTFLEAGDVLIARMPDPLGRACLFPGDAKQCVTAVDVCIVRTANNSVSHRWLMHTVNSPGIRVAVESLQSGSTRKRISRKNLGRLALPLPPSKQQRRIVEAIETQFTRLDAAVAALERAQAKLKRYRASVLKAACEGQIVPTEAELARAEGRDYEPADQLLQRILAERRVKWEQEHPGKKYKEPAPPDTAGLPELPEGWVWAAFGGIMTIRGGFAFSSKDYQHEGILLVRQGNLGEPGISLERAAYLPSDYLGEYSEYVIHKGDLLIGMSGSVGRTCVYDLEAPALQNQRTGLVQVHGGIEKRYVQYYLDTLKTQLLSQAKGVGVQNISAKDIQAMPFPLAPLREQSRIVAEVEQRLSLVDALERAVRSDLTRCGGLRQAILKRAFEGRLVPQDPSDEPASVLLERIKAQRSSVGAGL